MPRVHRPSRRAPRPSSPEKTRPDTGTLAALASNVSIIFDDWIPYEKRVTSLARIFSRLATHWTVDHQLSIRGLAERVSTRPLAPGCCCCWIACVSAPPPSAHHDAKATNARPVPRRLTPRVPFSRTTPHAPPPRPGIAPRRVTVIAATLVAHRAASVRSAPRQRASASAPQNESPAAVVSIACAAPTPPPRSEG